MGDSVWEVATEGAVLTLGRRPAWEEVTDFATPPSAADAGVYLEDAVRTRVVVEMRESVHARTARLTVETLDLTATYSVTIDPGDGPVVASYDASADSAASLSDVLEGIADAIDAASGIGVTATVDDDTVVIRGASETDYAITAFSATGTGVLAIAADPSSASARLYRTFRARVGTTAPPGWIGSAAVAVTPLGYQTREETGGIDRLHVQVSSVAGHPSDDAAVAINDPRVFIGPCLSENGQ